MFKFIRKGEFAKVKKEFPHEDATWMELVDVFQDFLQGCGYVFADGFEMREVLVDYQDKLLHERGINVKKKKGQKVWGA